MLAGAILTAVRWLALALFAFAVAAVIVYSSGDAGRERQASEEAIQPRAADAAPVATVVFGSDQPRICGTPVLYLDLLLRYCDPARLVAP